MNKKTYRIIGFGFLLLFNCNLIAQDDSTDMEMSDSLKEATKYRIDEVTIKSIRSDAKMMTSKTNIDKEYLEKFNIVQDAPYVFQSTPSLTYSSDAGNGVGYTNLSIRGVDNDRIQVSLNGVPYNDAESFQVYWVDIPDILSSADNVQLQRGIGFSMLGGVGLGGNISIKTTKRQKEPYLKWTTNMGSFNTYKNVLEMTSGDIGNGWQIYARGTQINSNGYIERATSDMTSLFVDLSKYGEKYTGHLLMTYGSEETYQAWYGVSQANIDSHNYRFNIAGTDYEQKSGNPYDNQVDNYSQSHFQFINNFYWNTKNKSSVTAYASIGNGYYEEYKVGQNYSNYSLNLTGSGDLVRQLCLSNDLYGLNLSHIFNSKKIENISAVSFNYYRGNHFGKLIDLYSTYTGDIPDRYYDNDANKLDGTVFDKLNISVGKSTFTIDAQFRMVYYNGLGTGYQDSINFDKTYYFFNPKIGWNLKTDRIGSFYTFAGFAFKEPNRNDILDADAHHEPIPEKVINGEIGYRWNNKQFDIQPNLFGMYYLDQLVPTGNLNDVGATIRENVGKSLRAGVELDFAVQIIPILKFETNQCVAMHKIFDYTYYEIAYNSDYTVNDQFTVKENYSFVDIAMSPMWVSFAAITLTPWKRTFIQLNNKVVSKQYLDNTESNSKSIPMYSFTNIYANYKFKPKFCKELGLHLYINNVLNSHILTRGYTYYSGNMVNAGVVTPGQDYNYYYPQSGINFMLGGSIKF